MRPAYDLFGDFPELGDDIDEPRAPIVVHRGDSGDHGARIRKLAIGRALLQGPLTAEAIGLICERAGQPLTLVPSQYVRTLASPHSGFIKQLYLKPRRLWILTEKGREWMEKQGEAGK